MGGRGVEVKTSWKFGNRWPLYVTHAFMDGCVNACVTGQSVCVCVCLEGGGLFSALNSMIDKNNNTLYKSYKLNCVSLNNLSI